MVKKMKIGKVFLEGDDLTAKFQSFYAIDAKILSQKYYKLFTTRLMLPFLNKANKDEGFPSG